MGESILKVFAAPASREAAAKWLADVERALTAQAVPHVVVPHVIVWGDAAFFADRALMNEAFTAWSALPRRSPLIVVRVGGARPSAAFAAFEGVSSDERGAALRIATVLSAVRP